MFIGLLEVIMAIFFLMMSFMMPFILFFILLFIVFHGHVKIGLYLLHKLGNFVLGDLVFLKDVGVLCVELVHNLLDVGVEDQSLEEDCVKK